MIVKVSVTDTVHIIMLKQHLDYQSLIAKSFDKSTLKMKAVSAI